MPENKVIIYTANDGKTKIDVKLEEETLWLTQAQMCELYQTSKSNVSKKCYLGWQFDTKDEIQVKVWYATFKNLKLSNCCHERSGVL